MVLLRLLNTSLIRFEGKSILPSSFFIRTYLIAQAHLTAKGWFSKASFIAKNGEILHFRVVIPNEVIRV